MHGSPRQKLSRLAGFLVAFIVTVVAAADNPVAPTAKTSAPLEFVGSMSVNREQFFMLFDPGTKENSGLLKLGQAWRGFVLRTYESAGQELVLSKDGREFALIMRKARVESENPGPPLVRGTFTQKDGKIIYSPDALLRLANGSEIFAHKGQMSFDPVEQIISGDITFTMQSRGIVLKADEGYYHVKRGNMGARKVQHVVSDAAAVEKK